MEQNAELADFLRTRRARLSPSEAGLAPGHGPRRVPGLRREEVARLAGVSTDYYTRLEQGRHPNVSETVLEAVARALRLDDDERGHLFDLARPRTSRTQRRRPERVQRVRPEVHQMLEVLGAVTPAFIANHRQDVLAANPLARALITDWDESTRWLTPPTAPATQAGTCVSSGPSGRAPATRSGSGSASCRAGSPAAKCGASSPTPAMPPTLSASRSPSSSLGRSCT
ncbi:helix-turn-helix domain-containing protein [Streptomyces melanosporofaciens]|uniref:Helix-turn-helix domain-containing protein n=1 Tax=Streptomyces melanosporofaciens TaxID=67327 RepID=A0A1H4ZJB1_STRMJ|nr:helix-turn-helix domain-containing protein [Streptomyces melanosporofaciens]SED30182.1 Helix-turn-helix domain-containing protein [Streptomyces melanosporofaciens]